MRTPKDTPIYQEIAADIENKIRCGHYPDNTLLPPERILSAQYQVERTTLRHALALLVERELIKKQQGSGNRVTFSASEPTVEKDSLENTIVYLIPDQPESGAQAFYTELCAKLEQLCLARSYRLIVSKVQERDTALPQWLYASPIYGIVCVGDVNEVLLKSIQAAEIPVILCCNETSWLPRINLDGLGGACLATNHLLQRGCKNILHITGAKEHHTAKRCLAGFRQAMLAGGSIVLAENILYGDWSYESGFQLTAAALSRDTAIDGIFAANDLMALGALNAALQQKRAVPNALKIIGTGNIGQSQTAAIPLSTVEFSQIDVAAALFLLLQALAQQLPVPEEIQIPGKLIVRASTWF